MKSKTMRGAMLIVAAAALVGCASSQQTFVYEPDDLDPAYWVEKVDRFVVIVDSSMTMDHRYQKEQKLQIERDMLYSMAQTIPDLDYEAGLRSFGGGKCLPKGKTALLSDVETYSTGDFDAGAGQLGCANGRSPLYAALDAAGSDFAGESGKLAAIVISDGRHMGSKTVKAAEALANQYGDNLCIYTVLLGDDKRGSKKMEKIAGATGCGSMVLAEDLTSSAAMSAFVAEALLYPDSDGDGVPDHLDECPDTPLGVEVDAVGCPLDSDGDGVPDYLDKCPGTPPGVAVNAEGCPLDSDGDGVPDTRDKCPNTPAGMKVNEDGCPDSDGDGVYDNYDKCPNTPRGVPVDANGCPPAGIEAVGDEWVIRGNVLFDVNKWDLKPEGMSILDQAAEFLVRNTQWHVEIQGHTDSTGPKEFNDTLSRRRAESAMKYLISKGVPVARLTAVGLGSSDPVAPNDTREGRAQNRRVDFKPTEK
jgi:OOP family OmpA-OmpF porin